MERDDIIKDWLEGKISTEELEKKLPYDNNVQELINIVEKSASLQVPQKRSKEEAWNKLSQKLQSQKTKRLNPWIPVSIAASLAVIIMSYFAISRSETVQAVKGEQLAYTLPDGSEVILNADSKITFREFKVNERRKVNLEGEAFFNIKPGGTFDVESEHGTVAVVGTSFNVKARDEKFEVACFSGSVKVMDHAGTTVVLQEHEFTRSVNNKVTAPQSVDIEKTGAWRKGEFYFENALLSDVLEELERQLGFTIVYNGKTDRLYSGYFDTKDPDEALRLVLSPMALQYKKEGDRIVIE